MAAARPQMDAFLASVEGRAFHMARMATGSREEALDIVQDAMFGWVRHYAAKPETQWRPLFYRVLHSLIVDWLRRDRETEKQFVEKVRRLLEDDLPLDAATRSRLNRTRQAALDRAVSRSWLMSWSGLRWISGGAAAAAALLLALQLGERPVPADLAGGPAEIALEIAAGEAEAEGTDGETFSEPQDSGSRRADPRSRRTA